MTIYLYIKQHNITKLKYLGKTIKNPYKYKGSGVDWTEHLKLHGNNVTTEIIKECHSNKELNLWGRFYSTIWDVSNSSEFLNRIPETGGGAGVFSEDGYKNIIKYQKDRVDDYTHHLLSGEIQGSTSRKRVLDGTHNLLGPETNAKRVLDGTHNFLDGTKSSEYQKRRVADGTHHFLSEENKIKKLESAKIKRQQQMSVGTHNFQIKGLTAVINLSGVSKRMSVAEYKSQLNIIDKNVSEWVSCVSNEGKRRRNC